MLHFVESPHYNYLGYNDHGKRIYWYMWTSHLESLLVTFFGILFASLSIHVLLIFQLAVNGLN